MSARSLTTAATLFAGPGRASNSTSLVNDSASFRFVLDGTIQTLSTENAPVSGPIKGLMFVPSLNPDDSCNKDTAPYIPANVTRVEDVLDFGYQIVGLAPWVSPACTWSFLNASQSAGTSALLFFIPSGNDTQPPPADDPVWSLGGGEEWKKLNQYPVYAIPGSAGATLMTQLALYPGNDTQLSNWNSSVGSASDDNGDVRIFTLIDLEKSGKKMPSLWGFILAILGTILVVSIILLLCYQLIQKRRRDNLQRRIEAGEADFEQLGLHQIKVPREVIDLLPIYTYPDLGDPAGNDSHLSPTRTKIKDSRRPDGPIEASEQTRKGQEGELETEIQTVQSSNSVAGENTITSESRKVEPVVVAEIQTTPSESTLPTGSNPQLPYPRHDNRLSHSQTTCAICLDDFIPNSSTVRELPCGHIYHPDCIDTSLTQNSSLCPLCKKSVLPHGYYPMPVTNSMVQRDHMLRQSR